MRKTPWGMGLVVGLLALGLDACGGTWGKFRKDAAKSPEAAESLSLSDGVTDISNGEWPGVGAVTGGCGAVLVRADWVLASGRCFTEGETRVEASFNGEARVVARWQRVPSAVLGANANMVLARLDSPIANVQPIPPFAGTFEGDEQLLLVGGVKYDESGARKRKATASFAAFAAARGWDAAPRGIVIKPAPQAAMPCPKYGDFAALAIGRDGRARLAAWLPGDGAANACDEAETREAAFIAAFAPWLRDAMGEAEPGDATAQVACDVTLLSQDKDLSVVRARTGSPDLVIVGISQGDAAGQAAIAKRGPGDYALTLARRVFATPQAWRIQIMDKDTGRRASCDFVAASLPKEASSTPPAPAASSDAGSAVAPSPANPATSAKGVPAGVPRSPIKNGANAVAAASGAQGGDDRAEQRAEGTHAPCQKPRLDLGMNRIVRKGSVLSLGSPAEPGTTYRWWRGKTVIPDAKTSAWRFEAAETATYTLDARNACGNARARVMVVVRP